MFTKRLKNITKKDGVTLVELLIATLILGSTFTALLLSFVRSMELNEISGHSAIAVLAAKNKLAEIENTAYNQIFANYNNVSFTLPAGSGINGIGVTYVNNADPDLLQITVTFCWQEKNGRNIGEDTNLNGQLNAGEDQNGNGILDSPVTFSTSIYNS